MSIWSYVSSLINKMVWLRENIITLLSWALPYWIKPPYSSPIWDNAFYTIVYLINMMPSSSINFQVSYILLFNIKHDYKFLRVFQCAWFLLLRLYNGDKLDFRSYECFFLDTPPHIRDADTCPLIASYKSPKMFCFYESRFPNTGLFPKFDSNAFSSTNISLPPLYHSP